MANIAFDVGKGNLRDRSDRYAKHFAKKIVKPLENNCLQVCDPNIDQSGKRFRKMNYEFPDEV